MTTDVAVVQFALGSFRAMVEDGVVRKATFDPTPQPAHRDPFGVHDVLVAYFAGEVRALDPLTVGPRGTAFQRAVWDQLRKTPAGTTSAYGEMARRVGKPTASRAVGMA